MTPECWKPIEQLYHAALKLKPAEVAVDLERMGRFVREAKATLCW